MNDLPAFQVYQQDFTAYIRAPKTQAKPKGVAKTRIAVYEEIVFNNLFDAVSACFPIAQKILGKRTWLHLVQSFLRNHSANSPFFRKIPEEFLSFLAQKNHAETLNLPDYFFSLCHYEWVELAVSSSNKQIDLSLIDHEISVIDHAVLDRKVVFTPSIQLLSYDYAVQTISPGKRPQQPVSTQLLVYRNSVDAVKFVALNTVTFRLLSLLNGDELSTALTIRQALLTVAEALGQTEPNDIVAFGLEVLEDLREQEIIIGVYYKSV